MSTGISIHIGLNRVDPKHYKDGRGKPWSGELKACENDAHSMQSLADKRHFRSQLILTEQATSQNVIGSIEEAAQELQKGDILFITYSGHGGQVPDMNSEFGENDELDETWCLYDRQVVDDELYTLWSKFQPGVRVFVLSDSCHSGTVAKDPLMTMLDSQPDEPAIKALPIDVVEETYKANQAAYDDIQAKYNDSETVDVAASVILISGCQDSQFSMDGKENGLFTGTMLRVWRDGKFKGNIKTFHRRIVDQMPYYQTPNLFKVGSGTSKFERQRPFLIEMPQDISNSLGGQAAEPPGRNGEKLYVDPEMVAAVPPDLRQAWVNYMKNGFDNNQVMFKRTLEAFMKPYNITVSMYVIIFIVGILFFCIAAYLGLTGGQPAVAISFAGLSVVSFVMFFIRQPVQALEQNLEFISWLGVAFNTYWTRLMYISNKETVQQDLKAANDDYSRMIERLINKHASLRAKLPGGKLEEAKPTEEKPADQGQSQAKP